MDRRGAHHSHCLFSTPFTLPPSVGPSPFSRLPRMTGSEYPQILRPLLCALLQPRKTFHVAQLQLPTRSTESLRGRFQSQGLLITFFFSLSPCIGPLALPFYTSILFQPCVISLIARILSCLHWRMSSSNLCSSSLTLSFFPRPPSQVREAIRATTAAPTYFYPLVRGGMVHSDGALLANNPTAIAIHEAKVAKPEITLPALLSLSFSSLSLLQS